MYGEHYLLLMALITNIAIGRNLLHYILTRIQAEVKQLQSKAQGDMM